MPVRNTAEIIMSAKDRASKRIRGVSGNLRAMGKVAAKAGALAATGLAVGSAAVYKLTLDTARLGDQFAKMSRRTGIGTKALSELAFAAEQSGTSIEDFENAIRRLQRGITDAEAGLTTTTRAFGRLGVEWKNQDGTLKEVDEILPEIAAGFNSLSTDTERAATAQELFGRSGTAIIPLLAEGADGMQALREEAEKLGRSFTEDAGKASEEFIDAQNRAKSAITGVRNAIGIELLPQLTDLADQFSDWVSVNRELIAQGVGDFISDAAGAMKTLYTETKPVLDLFRGIVRQWALMGRPEKKLGELHLELPKLQERKREVEGMLRELRESGSDKSFFLSELIKGGTGIVSQADAQREIKRLTKEINDNLSEQDRLIQLINEGLNRGGDAQEDSAGAAAATTQELGVQLDTIELLNQGIQDHLWGLDQKKLTQEELNALMLEESALVNRVLNLNKDLSRSAEETADSVGSIDKRWADVEFSLSEATEELRVHQSVLEDDVLPWYEKVAIEGRRFGDDLAETFGAEFSQAVVSNLRTAGDAWDAFIDHIKAKVVALVATEAFRWLVFFASGGTNPFRLIGAALGITGPTSDMAGDGAGAGAGGSGGQAAEFDVEPMDVFVDIIPTINPLDVSIEAIPHVEPMDVFVDTVPANSPVLAAASVAGSQAASSIGPMNITVDATRLLTTAGRTQIQRVTKR